VLIGSMVLVSAGLFDIPNLDSVNSGAGTVVVGGDRADQVHHPCVAVQAEDFLPGIADRKLAAPRCGIGTGLIVIPCKYSPGLSGGHSSP
jgi:hypothetical protein